MKELISYLENPFNGLKSSDVLDIQERCNTIAEKLFCDYGIKCGDRTFRFAEIEFYYYKKNELNNDNWDAQWNKETYPRNKKAGEFFYHYSGIDICFQCHFEEKARDNEYGEFGGILIRSLLDGNKIIAGPLFCANTMMNTCNNEVPQLVPYTHQICKWEKDIRCGINSDKKQEADKKLYLCYYAKYVNNVEIRWDKASEKISWDKKNEKFKQATRNYKKERGF